MGRLGEILESVGRVHKLVRHSVGIARDTGHALRFLEAHSDPNSRVGRRIRVITDHDAFKKGERLVNIADNIYSGVENLIHKQPPDSDLPIGHERIIASPRRRESVVSPGWSVDDESRMAEEIAGNMQYKRAQASPSVSALRRR
jgi:hypothetical protein